jgi:hypothetical protein
MNNKAKLLVALTATAASIFGAASHALAGQGGAAGAAAFRVNNNAVTGVAVAAAVGKQDAFAGAFNDIGGGTGGAGLNSAVALGSAGIISTGVLDATDLQSLTGGADDAGRVAQNNELGNYRVNINAVTGGTGDTVADFNAPGANPQ